MLTQEEKKKLINIARESIKAYFDGRKRVEFEVEDKVLHRKMGAFVTIKLSGALCGCIGNIVGSKPLYQTVSEMALQAAFFDPRFLPLKEEEYNDISLEISVLSELEKIDDVEVVKPGEHGLLIRQGVYSGLLLPQVATEYNWDREEFLCQTCLKAGLPERAWCQEHTEIYIFTAEVFGDKDL